MAATPTDLCQVPAGPPPPGVEPNFIDPTSLAPAKMTILSILVAWGIVFTSGRFYVNFRRLSLTDYLTLFALLLAIIILGLMSAGCAKASIFLLFQQIFTIQKTMRHAIWFGQAFNFALYATGVAIAIVYETPRTGEHWSAILDGRTVIPLPWWQAQSALIVALDIYIFILPLSNLWKLKIPIRRRISVLAVFSLALMGIAASIASFVERIYVSTAVDQTWISAILSLCSGVELNVAIIVSSGPGFASFVRANVPTLSSYAGSFFSMGSKTRDSEADITGKESNYASSDKTSEYAHSQSDKTSNASVAEEDSLDHSLRYYGLSDVHMMKSVAAADERHLESREGGIMRTMTVEQQIKTASNQSLRQ
ncbi:hypothetical protein IQ06DRAFT_335785 [Phaeosphaeriaceae sp. SRC1lsM3a]|nr:hypothetical protein IQ06DRAFT_335785 [Stagonospora sp. SRC1lsM3a]